MLWRIVKLFWKFSLRYKSVMVLMFLMMLIATVMDVLAPLFYKNFFDVLATNTPSQEVVAVLINILVMVFIIHSISWATWRVADFSISYFQPHIMADLRQYSFRYMMGHSYRFFTNNFAGSLVRKVNRLARSFETVFDQVFYAIIPIMILAIGNLTVLYFRSPLISLLVFAWIVVFIAINTVFAFWKQKYDIKTAAKDSEVTGVLADSITNNLNVQLFTGREYEDGLFVKVTEELRKLIAFAWNLNHFMMAIQVILMIVIEFILMYVAVDLWSQGVLTLGDFALIQAYMIMFFSRMWDFGRVVRRIFEAMADAREMVEILEMPHEVRDLKRAKEIKIKKGKIEFKKVEFSFNKNRKVLNKINFTIKPGEKVALVGPSGAGKSTITKLIFRHFDIQKGKILIDGQDISKVTQESLRSLVSLVPQEPILFHRTLMDNIRYGRRDATDEEVVKAAKLAHCDDFIARLPEGYATFVGERGIKLSGGERQRVAIARAILKDAPILVLDEATSSLDSESESLIQNALEELMKERTTIVIAHRLSTIMQMDRILVIDDGKVVDKGTHKQLLQKKGIYKKLWDIQVGGFMPEM